MIVDFTIAIGHMTRSSYELMWIFNFVRLTPRLTIGDVHEDIQKLRVIDKVKASVAAVYERRNSKWNLFQPNRIFLSLIPTKLIIFLLNEKTTTTYNININNENNYLFILAEQRFVMCARNDVISIASRSLRVARRKWSALSPSMIESFVPRWPQRRT